MRVHVPAKTVLEVKAGKEPNTAQAVLPRSLIPAKAFMIESRFERSLRPCTSGVEKAPVGLADGSKIATLAIFSHFSIRELQKRLFIKAKAVYRQGNWNGEETDSHFAKIFKMNSSTMHLPADVRIDFSVR